jgi:hypothetical protein
VISLIFNAIISLSAAGATADDMVLDLGADLNGRPAISAAEVHEDIEFLKSALIKSYAGPDFSRRLSAIPSISMSSQSLCDRLAAALEPVRDAHLSAGLEFSRCGTRLPSGQVGTNLASEAWRLEDVHRGGKHVDVLAIPAFWPRFDERWDGFLDAVKSLRTKGRPFIIDLRGNSGGDDSMGFEMARILLGLPDNVNLPTPVESRHFRQTPEAFAVLSNTWAYSILRARARGQTVPVYMTQRRDEILSWKERAKRGEFPAEYIERLPEQPVDERLMFREKVYVLVDRACGSSCETTLQVLEKLPGRRLIGENSMGAVEYGETGRVVLPNSRVSVTLSTMHARFRDHRHIEKTGYAPAVRVPAGRDALDAAFRQL